MNDKVPKLFWWLSRDEFQTVYAFQYVGHEMNCYGFEQMPKAAADEIFESYGKAFRFAIAKLAVCHGMRFEGLNVDDEGRLSVKDPNHPVEPRNELYYWKIKRGSQPHPGVAIRTALEVRERLRLDFDPEPMRILLNMIDQSIREAIDSVTPEDLEAIKKEIEKMCQEAGWVTNVN